MKKLTNRLIAIFIVATLVIPVVPFNLVAAVLAANAFGSSDVTVNLPDGHTFVLEANFRELPYVTFELENHTSMAMENLQAHFESSNTNNSEAFQIRRGFSPGLGNTPYNSHNQIPPNVEGEVPFVNIRISPQENLTIGNTYEDILVITRSLTGDDRAVIAEIPLRVVMNAHPGVRPAAWAVNFGTIHVGFDHALTVNAANSAGPRQINLRNMSTATPVYLRVPYYPYEELINFVFDRDTVAGDSSPFFIYREVRSGTSATYATGPYTNVIPVVASNSTNIRIGVRPGLGPGHHTDILRMDGLVGFEPRAAGSFITVEVTVLEWENYNVTIPTLSNPFEFPTRPQGYPAFAATPILATTVNPESNNARQFNFTNNSSVPVTGVTAAFDNGNYFEIIRSANDFIFRLGAGVSTSATTARWLDYIPPNGTSNLRIRPIAGLEPGIYNDTLRVFSGSGHELAVIPMSFTVVDWVELGFEFMVRATRFPGTAHENYLFNTRWGDVTGVPVTSTISFPTRQIGYTAFTTSQSVANSSLPFSHRSIFITNLRTDSAIEGLHVSWQSVNEGIFTDSNSPFIMTRGLSRDNSVIGIGNSVPSTRMDANNAAASLAAGTNNIMIAPRTGLLSGVYTDVLQVRGYHGFAVDIPVRFVVTGPPAGITISPNAYTFTSRQVGYAFAAASGGWREFLIANNSSQNYTHLRVQWENGGRFAIQRDFRRNNVTNPSASTTALQRTLNGRPNSNSSFPHIVGIRIWPVNGLPVGTHTDTMIIMARDPQCTAATEADFSWIELTRSELSFTVHPPPETWPDDFTVQPGARWNFGSRLFGYSLAELGQIEFVFRNTRSNTVPNRITDLQASLTGLGSSNFLIERPLTSATINGGGTANIRVRPQLGLLPGEYRAYLTLTGRRDDAPFTINIPLYFRVLEPDFSVRAYGRNYTEAEARTSHTRFDWHPRYYGLGSGTGLFPYTAETLVQTLRPVEFIFTNHTSATVTLPATNTASALYHNMLNTPYFIVFRQIRAHTLENTDVSSSDTTVILPGASVGIRLIPHARLPVGYHSDTFTLRDINDIPLATIDMNIHVMDWSGLTVRPRNVPGPTWSAHIAGSELYWPAATEPGMPRPSAPYVIPSSGGFAPVTGAPVRLPVFELPSKNQGYISAESSLLEMSIPMGNYNHDFWGDFSLDHASGNIAIYFYDGPDGTGWEGYQTGSSEFFELYWTALSGASATNSPRHIASIRPVMGLPVGVYEDVLVFRSRVINYSAGTMDVQRFIIYVPVRFEVLPHTIAIYPPMEVLPNVPGDHHETIRIRHAFQSMPRGYTVLEEHAVNIAFRNMGNSSIAGITAEFLTDQSTLLESGPHAGQIAFSIMDPPGFSSTTPRPPGAIGHILGAYPTGQLGISLWPRNMLSPSDYEAVLRISDGAALNIYIHLSFAVDSHDVSFPDDVEFDPVFVDYQPDEFQRAVIEIESFETTHTLNNIDVIEWVDSPFEIVDIVRVHHTADSYAVLPWNNSIGPRDIIRITVAPNENYPNITGFERVHTDELIIRGGDFERIVDLTFAVYEISTEVTAPDIGIMSNVGDDPIVIPPQRLNYSSIPPVAIHIRNTSPIAFTGLTGGELPIGSDFVIYEYLDRNEIQPGEIGIIYVRPQMNLAVGTHNTVLIFEGDKGFELEIEISFTVFDFTVAVQGYEGQPRLIDPIWLEDSRFIANPDITIPNLTRMLGYTSVNAAPFEVTMIGSGSFANFNVSIEGTNASSFAIENANLFPTYWSEYEKVVINVRPLLNLPVGVYVAELVLYATGYGELQRVPLSFEVLADHLYEIDGNGDFGTKVEGYYEVPYNTITLRNLDVADIHDLRTYIRLPDGSEISASTSTAHAESAFVIVLDVQNRLDSSDIVMGTLWGNLVGSNMADVSVRPQTGLPVGIYNEYLIIRGVSYPAGENLQFVIPLRFEVIYGSEPELYPPLQNVTVTVGEPGDSHEFTITVVSPTDGSFTFQWQSATAYNGEFTNISGATGNNFNAPINVIGRIYYRVVVTNSWTDASGNRSVSVTSNVAYVNVIDFVHAQQPLITTHPQSATVSMVDTNATHTLTVAASSPDGGVLSFQWYRAEGAYGNNFVRIDGATGINLAARIDVEGINRYRVVVTNYLSSATGNRSAYSISDIAVITVNALINAQVPNIITHPQDETVNVNQPVTLTVEASVTDGGVLTYQWYRAIGASGGVFLPISDANGTSLDVSTSEAEVNRYRVVVTNYLAEATGNQIAEAESYVAIVTVKELTHATVPEITGPDSVTVLRGVYGATHPLTVTVLPPQNGVLTYQWQRVTVNGYLIEEITGAIYETFYAPIDVDGRIYYRVIVTNVWDDATGYTEASAYSDIAFVQVDPRIPERLVIYPDVLTIRQGDSFTFIAEVFDQVDDPYANQAMEWNLTPGSADIVVNGTSVIGGILQIASNQDLGTLILTVTSQADASVYSTVIITVIRALALPEFILQPVSVVVDEGENAEFTVEVIGYPTPTLQWQIFNAPFWVDINGETDAVLQLNNVSFAQNGNNFRVRASNSVGTVYSQNAMLTVIPAPPPPAQAPIITSQPESVEVSMSQPVNLWVEAHVTDGGTLSFQWQRAAIGMGSSTFYDIPYAIYASFNPETSVSGINLYRVVITNTITVPGGSSTAYYMSSPVAVVVWGPLSAPMSTPEVPSPPIMKPELETDTDPGADDDESDPGDLGTDDDESNQGDLGADDDESDQGDLGADDDESDQGDLGTDDDESDPGDLGTNDDESDQGDLGADDDDSVTELAPEPDTDTKQEPEIPESESTLVSEPEQTPDSGLNYSYTYPTPEPKPDTDVE